MEPFFSDFFQQNTPPPATAPLRAWATVDLSALADNFRCLQRALPFGCRPIAVVKANAYGHGAPLCAAALAEAGCRHFAVATLEEGIEVRRTLCGRKSPAELLLLGYTPVEQAAQLHRHCLTQALPSPAYARELERSAEKSGVLLPVHIAVDTGMNRLGFAAQDREQIEKTAEEITQVMHFPHLQVTGIFTHLATPGHTAAGREQADRFRRLLACLDRIGIPLPFSHVFSSAGIGDQPCLFDGVRVGISLYGAGDSPLSLSPVMRLQTRIVHLHRLEAGTPLGYGGAFTSSTPLTVATLSMGYADGLSRACTGAYVTVHTGKGDFSCPLIGSVCMDLSMLDVTGVPARVGDVVTLFGNDRKSLSRLASHAGTIPYEILARLSPRVTRVYRYKTTEGNQT